MWVLLWVGVKLTVAISQQIYKQWRSCLKSNQICPFGAKNIQMQLDIPPSLPSYEDSDEEALLLFNNLNPDANASPPVLSEEESEARPLGRLSKLKKQSKKDKKKAKKEKRMRRLQKKMRQVQSGVLNIVTPLKTHKKRPKHKGSDSEGGNSNDAGSSQFSSESEDKQKLQDELMNLHPDAANEEEQGGSPRKRLKRSGRKMRIEEKQGFRVEELGNEAQVLADKFDREYMDEDYSFDDVNKSKKKRKPKRNVPTNQQIMNQLKQTGGVVESDGQAQREGAAVDYDNGLQTLYAMKDKKKGAIRINNKFFCDLDIDPKDEEAPMPTPETLELEIKPKNISLHANRFTFLNKAQALKKQRGLDNSVDVGEYERKMQEKAKQSLAKVVTAMISQQYHDDIELEVRVPTIARGKSADIINNTVFLKAFSRQSSDPVEQAPQPEPKLQHTVKKEGLSRQQFYKQMTEDTRMKRSKRFSEAQLKDSFKKTNLCELEEARKRNQEKRRKEALSEEGEGSQDESYRAESKMDQLLEEEERICGDRAQEEQPEQAQPVQREEEGAPRQKVQPNHSQDQLQEVEFKVQANEAEDEQPQKEGEAMQLQEEQEEINEENEVIEELASASHHERASQHEEQEQEQEQEGNGEEQQEQQQQQQEEPGLQNQEQSSLLPQDIAEPNPQQLHQQMQLEQQGIMLRKRKVADRPIPSEYLQKAIHPQPSLLPTPTSEQKQNAINLPNTGSPLVQSPALMTAEEHAEQFRNFKKLRKFAMVIAQKRRIREQGRRYASQFIEQQAEQGSDNEQHDDMVKKIDYEAEEQEYAGVDLDADLVELIDNAVDLNQADEQQAFRKYLEDIRIKDREEIRKIIRGEFRSHQHEDDFDMDEDERKRHERMEEVMKWMKQREEEDGQGIYLKPPEEEEGGDSDSDFDSEFRQKKKKKAVLAEEEEIGPIPQEEEKAMVQKFLENTVPATKRESKQVKIFDLGQLPQSFHMHAGIGRKIGLSSLGTKLEGQPKLKKLSSLANEVLSKSTSARPAQKVVLGKQVRR